MATTGDETSLAVSDLGFLDLCSMESHRFRVRDVLLFISGVRLDPLTCDIGNSDRVTFVTLTFTTQKSLTQPPRLLRACVLVPRPLHSE
jgi:hypothetical protein